MEDNPYRKKSITIITSELKDNIEITPKHIKIIEKSIYKRSQVEAKKSDIPINWENEMYINLYNQALLNIITNIVPTSHVQNTELIKQIPTLTKEELKLIAFKTPQELFPDNWTDILTEKELKDKAKTTVKTSTYLKCRKCGSRDINVETVQTRSADEGMTTFQTCTNCGNVKKS